MKVRALLGVLLLLPIAGCLGFGDKRPDYEAVETAAEELAAPLLVFDHGDPEHHYHAALHAGAYNVERVAYHNGFDETADPNMIPAGGYYTELAVTDEYAYVARASGDGSYGGFSILSVRPGPDGLPQPRLVGAVPGLTGGDIEISDDETLAFFATQRNSIEQVAGGLSGQQDPFAILPRGIVIADIEDKSNPAVSGFFPLPYNGPHTLTYHQAEDGTEYIIACTYDLMGNTFPSSTLPPLPLPFMVNPATQRVIVLEVQRNSMGSGAGLIPVAEWSIRESGPEGRLFFPHDAVVEVRDERTLIYVAYWDKGVQVLEFVSGSPPQLVPLGSWTEFSPSGLNAIHRVAPFDEPIAGRNLVVAEPEIVSAEDETGYITFVDVSDPENPVKPFPGSHWTLPDGHAGTLGVVGLNFSPHNFDTFDGKVALAHNHAGLWIIDVSDERNLQEPSTVGFFMDVPERDDMTRPQPYFWGVFERNGLLYAVDEGTGLHILRYTGP